jgi:hypothetical protein
MHSSKLGKNTVSYYCSIRFCAPINTVQPLQQTFNYDSRIILAQAEPAKQKPFVTGLGFNMPKLFSYIHIVGNAKTAGRFLGEIIDII